MGVSMRYFLVEDGTERLVRIPSARVWRWYAQEELAPQFAGRTVRCLSVVCSTQGRRVTRIEEVRGRRWRFLADGRLDVERERAIASKQFELHMAPILDRRPDRGLDIMPRVRRRRLDEKTGFKVTEEHLRALRTALLGGTRLRRA